MTANVKRDMLHNEGVTTELHQHNFQILRDDIYMLGGRHRDRHRIAPARSSSAYWSSRKMPTGVAVLPAADHFPRPISGRRSALCSSHVRAGNQAMQRLPVSLVSGQQRLDGSASLQGDEF